MDYNVNIKNNIGEIKLSGEPDFMDDFRLIVDEAQNLIDKQLPCVLNLKQISYIPASFCNIIIKIFKNAKANHTQLILRTAPESHVTDILKAAGIMSVIPVYLVS